MPPCSKTPKLLVVPTHHLVHHFTLVQDKHSRSQQRATFRARRSRRRLFRITRPSDSTWVLVRRTFPRAPKATLKATPIAHSQPHTNTVTPIAHSQPHTNIVTAAKEIASPHIYNLWRTVRTSEPRERENRVSGSLQGFLH